jgi:hypothetical protein
MASKPNPTHAVSGPQSQEDDPHPSRELRDHIAQDPPEVVHHYTSQQGLLGIVTNAEIWATSINNLNDAREFEHAKSAAIDLLEQQQKGATDETVKRHLGYLQHAAQSAGINICVASWSTRADDLSQWRAYSGAATGYSVDMSGAALRRFAMAQGFLFAACVYHPEEQTRLLNSLIEADLAKNLLKEKTIAVMADRERAQFEQHLIEENGGDFGYHMNRYAALFKDRSFENEGEWRLISRPISVDRMRFRAGQSTIVSYFPFSLRDDQEQRGVAQPVIHLVSVHVGPCPMPELACSKVRFLLAKHSPTLHHPKIFSSKVPYRTW